MSDVLIIPPNLSVILRREPRRVNAQWLVPKDYDISAQHPSTAATAQCAMAATSG
jgi:hypothetical protein